MATRRAPAAAATRDRPAAIHRLRQMGQRLPAHTRNLGLRRWRHALLHLTGKPIENAYIESFKANWVMSVRTSTVCKPGQCRETMIEAVTRAGYTTVRLHSAIADQALHHFTRAR